MNKIFIAVLFGVLLAHCVFAGKSFGGYVNVNKQYDANLYFWFIESDNRPSSDPVILWLQGGPGCSSLFGAFVENGPLLIQSDGSLKSNPYSWTKNASVLYVDSPVGTGFSYVTRSAGYAKNEKTIAAELYTLLNAFFYNLYPQYNKLPFYIFAESYGGKYAPWLASTILTNNAGSSQPINLQGVGIGDGWTNPYIQTGAYAEFLYANNLINELEYDYAWDIYQGYKALLDLGEYSVAGDVGNSLLNTLVVMAGGVDVYDIRYFNGDPTDILQNALTTYLNQPNIQQQMGAKSGSNWQACSNTPYFYLVDDQARSAEFLLPQILAKVPVMLYNGNKDLICNMIGTSEYAATIDWPYRDQFNHATNHTWSVSNKVAGYYKTANNLTHLIIYNAGHMVPFSQPQPAQFMAYNFIKGGFKP